MAGVSFAIGRLSAITGASSAAGGAALSGIGFAAAGLAAGFETASLGGDFTSAGLPPLMACSDGLASPGFALAALSAVLIDLLALFIARAPCCPRPPGPRLQGSERPRYDPEAVLLPFMSAP